MFAILKALLFAPYFTEAPEEIVREWIENLKKAGPGILEKLLNKTPEDLEEMAKSILKNIDSCFIGGGKRQTHEQMMEKTRDSLEQAVKKYPEAVKEGFKTFDEKIERAIKDFIKGWVVYTGPLEGHPEKGKIGLASLGMMTLTGREEILECLKEEDEMEGDLVCVVDKVICRRNLLGNKLRSAGSSIIKTGYSQKIIRIENERINKLVDEHRAEGIAPFAPDGYSYINFRMVETKDPESPDKIIKRLVLDIQVSTLPRT